MGRVVSSRSKKTDDWMGRARLIIEQRGLTYDDLAPALEVGSRSAVGHYLAGRRELSARQAVKLAECLQCRVGWLLTGETPIEVDTRKADEVVSTQEVTRLLNELPSDVYTHFAKLIVALAGEHTHNLNIKVKGKRKSR